MWRVPALARTGEWLCLLGSFLALVAFFLPYYTLPPEKGIPSRSLWDIFILLVSQTFSTGNPLPLFIGALLLLLLCDAVLALLVLVLRSPQRKLTTLALSLSNLTLMYYLFAAGIALIGAWVDEELADTSPNGVSLLNILSLANIGAWLMLAGLVLAFVGGILLKFKGPRRAAESIV